MQEEALQGNENIEQAIAALQQNATPELLAHALTAIRRRIRENGQFVVAVEPNPGTTQMSLKVVQTPDGRAWWYAFTSFEEEMRGAEQVQSTFMADIGKLLETALTVPEIEGIILNPWHRTLMLDKTLIQIFLPVKVPSYTSAAPQLGLRGCRMASSTPFSLAMANALAAPARNAASTLTPSFVTTSPFTISAGVRGTDRPPSTSGQTGMTSCPCTKAAAFSL